MGKSYKESSEDYKVQKREPAPEVPKVLSKRKKRPKPFVVSLKTSFAGWIKLYTAETRERAEAYIAKWNRSGCGELSEMKIEEKPNYFVGIL